MDNIEALLTTLKIYIETPSKVTQGFYQGLCVKAKETIEHLQAELQPVKEENEWFRQDNEWKDVVHNQTNAIGKLRAELQQVKEENGRLKEATNWLLEEYHFLSRKMTVINNVVGGLWGELRERRNDYQLIEKFIEQVQKEGLEEALKDKPDA